MTARHTPLRVVDAAAPQPGVDHTSRRLFTLLDQATERDLDNLADFIRDLGLDGLQRRWHLGPDLAAEFLAFAGGPRFTLVA